MFQSLALTIGLRYTRAKKRNHFISFISMSSMIGIALGVMVLITVLAVMSGFDEQIQKRVFSMAPQVTMSTYTNFLPDWQTYANKVKQYPEVVDSAPYIVGQGMLSANDQVHPAMIFGVIPALEAKMSDLKTSMVEGQLNDLKPNHFGIILGEDLAEKIGVGRGEKITLITPVASLTPIGLVPRYKRFTVVGVFNAGSGFGFDSNYAYINLHDAQTLYQLDNKVSGLRLKLNDVYKAPEITDKLIRSFPGELVVSNWTQQYGPFFEAVRMEKTMMFLILLLIIGIAAFNLVSSLVMVVTDKQADIAILRTLGATPKLIMAIFMVQGSIIGFMGVGIGLVSGIILALNVTEIVNWIQGVFGIQLLSSSVYYVNYLPSKLQWMDVLKVSFSALLMSFFATLYPALRASKIQPVEALRYE
jgi:lipoprotein-releasing system permease protein